MTDPRLYCKEGVVIVRPRKHTIELDTRMSGGQVRLSPDEVEMLISLLNEDDGES